MDRRRVQSSWVSSRISGIGDLTFHDLRGTAVVRLAIAGATVPQIATFTGHSLKDVEAISMRTTLARHSAR